MVMKNLKQNFV